jgi:hypothetical protein
VELDPDFTLPDVDWSDNRTSRWPRLQWMLDNGRMSPRPIGKTLGLWRPDLWYQSDAGVQTGVAFDASTIRWEHALQGTAGFEARDRRFYGDFEARFRSVAADPRRVLRARGYDMDGHRGFRVSIAQELGSKIALVYLSSLTVAVS